MLKRAYRRPRLPPKTESRGSHAWNKSLQTQKKRSKEKSPSGSYRLGCVGGYIFWLRRTGRWAGSRGRHRTTNMAWRMEREREKRWVTVGNVTEEIKSALHALEKRLAWWLTPVWSGIGSSPCCSCVKVEEKPEFGRGPAWAKEATLCQREVMVRSRTVHVLLKWEENGKNWRALLRRIPGESRKSGLKSRYSNVTPNRKKTNYCFSVEGLALVKGFWIHNYVFFYSMQQCQRIFFTEVQLCLDSVLVSGDQISFWVVKSVVTVLAIRREIKCTRSS